MICFARNFLCYVRRQPIRLCAPAETLVITGCRSERIAAEFGSDQRLVRLIIYTRQRSLGDRPMRFR